MSDQTGVRSYPHVVGLPGHSVISAIQNIFGDGIDSSFTTIYLGNSEAHILAKDKYLLKTDILAASKKAATQTWLQDEPPTKTDWVDAVSTIQGI